MGLRDRFDDFVQRARPFVVEDPRTVILLSVDLSKPAATRKNDRDPSFTVQSLQEVPAKTLVAAMTQHDAAHAEGLAQRLTHQPEGAVVFVDDQPVGYVLWRPGNDDPTATIHPDLPWLGFSPRGDELYVYDYYVVPSARGVGSAFVRAVQRQHLERGYTQAFGYVHADNRAALWLYRTTGWKEVGRLDERRLLRRLVVVNNRLYWVGKDGRQLLTGRVL